MSLTGFIRSVEESQDEFDVGLREFDADSEREAVDDGISDGRSWGRLLLVTLFFMSVTYTASRLRSSSDDSFTDIVLADGPAEDDSAANEKTGTDDDATNDEDATVAVRHNPKAEAGGAAADDEVTGADETGDTDDEETDANDDGVVEVEIESPGDNEE